MKEDRTATDGEPADPDRTMRLATVTPWSGTPHETPPAVTEEAGHAPARQPVTAHAAAVRTSSWRRPTALALALTVLAAGGAATAATLWPDSTADRPAAGPGPVRTVPVTRTTLSDHRSLSGTLGFGTLRTLQPYGSEGRVTWLPAPGTVIERNESVWRVDDRPVVLLYGETPVFRPLDTVGLVGRDVRVVADHLRSLGYDIGPQPAEGTWVNTPARAAPAADGAEEESARPPATAAPPPVGASPDPASAQPHDRPEPDGTKAGASAGPDTGTGRAVPPATTPTKVRKGDAVLTPSLMDAVRRWQRSLDIAATGVIRPEDVFVTSRAVRVGKVLADVGSEVTTGLIAVTSTHQQVTVAVDAADAGAVRRDARVRVTLPDQTRVDGTVTAVGTVVEDDQGDGTGEQGATGRLTVTVRMAGEVAAQGLESGPVQVEFPGRTRRDVLAVPVGALLALSEGGYAVRTADGRLIAVSTGMFARGMVEVTGSGLREGLRVETSS
ncbi:peptidoglycan-binding protein [Streptomyces sp. NPDC094143]|uniref:peptidoglycan-binding protein n=1 Tax=Streptomyces sp. NPDC094143 TaxID=3155310 RepID=UPI00332168EB